MAFKHFLIGILFLFSANLLFAQVPTTSDCLGAIPVCEDIYFEPNAYEGSGNYENELHPDVCIKSEDNSVWYRFVPKQSGFLGFEIIPNDLDDDYDWAVFNITNVSCSDLLNNFDALISCNATGKKASGFDCYGITGANNGTIYNFQNKNCGVFPPTMTSDGYLPFNAYIPVLANNIYVLLIVNFTNSTNGYTLDFTKGENVEISDNERPAISEFTPLIENCESRSINFITSELIQCSSINALDISISPGGPYTITLESTGCNNSEFSNEFSLNISPPLELDIYTVSFNEDPLDLCDNNLEQISFNIDLNTQSGTDISYDTISCKSIILDASSPGALSYLWNDASTSPTLSVNTTAVYEVIIETECNSFKKIFNVTIDSIEIREVILNNEILCNTNEASIEIIDIDGSSPFSFSLDGVNFSPANKYSDLEPGNYTLVAMDNLGCTDAYSFTIVDNRQNLLVDLPNEYSISSGDTLLLYPILSGPYINAFWTNNLNSLECDTCVNNKAFPVLTTPYTFTVIDLNGCPMVRDIIVRVEAQVDIYAPNIFSPNEDGINDIFTIYGQKDVIEVLELAIYNRWGELMFKNENFPLGDLEYGWDGNFKSKYAGIGVYSWVAKVRFIDNREVVISGSLTIVR